MSTRKPAQPVNAKPAKKAAKRKRRAPLLTTSFAVPTAMPSRAAILDAVARIRETPDELGLAPANAASDRMTLRHDARTPEEFIAIALEVALAHPELMGVAFDAASATADQQYIAAMEPIELATRQLLRQVEDEILRRKAALGAQSRNLHRHLHVLAQTPHRAEIADALDRMSAITRKRAAPKGKSKSKKSDGATSDAKTATTPPATPEVAAPIANNPAPAASPK